MKIRTRNLLLIIVVLLILPVLVFSGGQTEKSEEGAAAAVDEKYGGTVRVSVYHEFVTGDPHKSSSYVDRQLLQNVYNTLVTYDAELNYVPELAESWTTPNDTTYIFKLRKGVKFHDGTEFNAEAVKFNLERVLDPATKSRGRGEISAIESVEVIDSFTVKLNLSFPFSALFDGLTDRAGFMISPTAFNKMGADEFSRNPVGTGPFKFAEWIQDDHLTIERFEDYWEEGLPYLDRIIFKPIPDQAVKLINLRSGALDIIDDVLPKDVELVKKDNNLVLHEIPSYGFNAIRLNTTKAPFDNMALRQAVAYAIDKESIWKHIFYGSGVMGHGPIAPVSWAYSKEAFQFPYDPEKSREKLREGGKPDGFSFKVITKISSIDVQVAQAMQAQLKEVGIEMEIEQAEGARHLKVMLDHDYEGNYGLWSGYPASDTNLYRQFHPKGSAQWTGYTHPRVTELLDKARATLDQNEAKKYYAETLDIIIREAPQIFVYYYPRRTALNVKVQDFVPYPDGKLRLKSIWLKK